MSYELNIRCKHCDRFIPIQSSSSATIKVRCNDRKCKQWNEIKVVMLSDFNKDYHNHRISK